jgi:hypothetical protein
MAWDAADEFITLPATTGLRQFQFVTVNSAGKAANPTAGGRVLGVLVSSGTNNSTEDVAATVQILGIAKVLAKGSTLGVGDTVSASSIGYAKPSTSGGYVIGLQVDGSSGSTGRIVSVSLTR